MAKHHMRIPKGITQKEDGRWYVRKMIGGKPYRRIFPKGQKGFIEAQDYLQKLETFKDHPAEGKAALQTFAELLEVSRKDILLRVGKTNQATYKKRLDYLNDRFGERVLGSLTKADMIELQVSLLEEEDLAPKTVNDYCQLFARVLEHAVELEILPKNPVKPFRSLSIGDSFEKRNPLTDDEYALVMKYLPNDWFRSAVIAYCETGCRLRELINVSWKEVDLERGILTIRSTADNKVKTKSGNRLIPLSVHVLQILKANHERQTAFPFPNSDDSKKMNPNTIQNRWKAVKERIKEKEKVDIKSRWHDLRHRFGVKAASLGVPLTALQRIMGHKNIEETAWYAALTDEQAIDVFNRVNPFS